MHKKTTLKKSTQVSDIYGSSREKVKKAEKLFMRLYLPLYV